MTKVLLGFLFSVCIFSKAYGQLDEYKSAQKIAASALEKLKSGAVSEGDSLIRASIALYPTHSVMKYLEQKAKLNDVAGANILLDVLIDRIKKSREPDIYLKIGSALYSDSNDATKFDKEFALIQYLTDGYALNTRYGSRYYHLRILKQLNDMIIDKKSGYYYTHKMFQIQYASLVGDYDLVDQLYAEMPKSLYSVKDREINRLYLKEQYEEVIKLVKTKRADTIRDRTLFGLYAILGNDLTLKLYENLPKSFQIDGYSHYSLGIFYNKKQNYSTALKHLDTYVSLRDSLVVGVNIWELHTAYGEAYIGLKQYSKARDHYNIALLNYSEYKPALAGMANLEKHLAAELATDKTGPIIAITDPSPSRGLKVIANSTNVMVKGNALDPAGVKEVKINGVPMFVQATGDFWGDVAMTPGINKIAVTAVDNAGNTSEKTFDMEYVAANPVNTAPTEIVAVTGKKGKNICLLIAAQNYFDSTIPSLNKPISDAIRLKIILKEQYGFANEDVVSLFNPTVNEIKAKLLELSTTIQPEDNLLIFYAGHGIWVDKDKKGYWLMSDSKFNDQDTWLPNKIVLDLIAKLPSKHTLLITDACFSGSVFKTRGIPATAPANIQALNEKISRVAITSGNDSEVPDESVFMKYLVKALSENKDKYLTAQKMFITQIIEAVMTETKTEPRYGTLEQAGHVGGDFIFIKK